MNQHARPAARPFAGEMTRQELRELCARRNLDARTVERLLGCSRSQREKLTGHGHDSRTLRHGEAVLFLLGEEDLQLRRTILAAESLTFAAELLQWPLSRLSERLRRQKQAAWWREVKARWSDERRRERAGRARERRRERRRRCPP
jgi:hypothetical protein